LSRFKEVEELYTEIMKSVDETKIERDEDIELVYACPAATVDQSLEDHYNADHILVLRKVKPKIPETKATPEPVQQTRATPNIRKSTNRVRIHADMFRINRKRAMNKIKSSRYHFKYNYGGYIPAKALSKESQANQISTNDYDDHLAHIFCDFVPMLLYKEKREAERLQEIEQERLRDEELLRRQREKELEEQTKQEKVRELFEPEPDHWKVSVLDYIAPEETKDPDDEIPSAPSKGPHMQKMLEKLWSTLHMPADQKLDMAIKYGSHKFSKIGEAFQLWQDVADLILARESLLEDIEEFEMKASDPQ
jgi:hypothetical protein